MLQVCFSVSHFVAVVAVCCRSTRVGGIRNIWRAVRVHVCVVVCCRCVSVCCSLLQCVAVCCSVLQVHRSWFRRHTHHIAGCLCVCVVQCDAGVFERVAVCCSVSQVHWGRHYTHHMAACVCVCVCVCAGMRCSEFQLCFSVCCSVVQCECVTVWCMSRELGSILAI